jgi:hypothetical protein
MGSNQEDPHSPSSDEEEAEMAQVLRSDLEYQYRELQLKLRQVSDSLAEARDRNRSQAQRVLQLNSEIEVLRGQLRDLNLLDGFLRSGAVKALNLESDPTLRVLLTSFLARALQAALDTGAVQFPSQRKDG